MKILMLTPYLPYPLYSGGQIRTYNLLKNLSKTHEITLLSFIRDEKEKKYIGQLKKYCQDVRVFKKRPPWSFTSLTLAAITFYPLVVCLYLQREVKRIIAQMIEEKHFDLIHAETFYVMPNIPKTSIPIILVEQTIEYLVYQHYMESVKFWPLKALMNFDVNKIFHWEKEFWKRAHHVVAMSQRDKKLMQKVVPTLVADIVPNGVDPDFFSQTRKNMKKTKKTVLFVGNFKWLQNREAVFILIYKIWPRIIKRISGVKLWIVGRFPPDKIRSCASDSIVISDTIEDIRDAYSNSDVMLAPIYGPGGTRYKILEAMATGLPVVTTPTGIEGLRCKSGQEVLIGNSIDQLSQQTVNVLTNKQLYSTLAINGRKLVEKNFSWINIAQKLDDIYKEAVLGRIR